MDVGNWLRGLRLGQYAAAFQENAVDAETLRQLTAEDLKELGVSLVGHRRKLLEAIDALTDDHVSSIGSRSAVAFWNDDGKERGIDAAERRQLTILFCDLVGSTALSAQLDPEDLRKLIHIYHAATAQEVERFGGFIAKYMGDGVLAYFGFPHAHENDAERALLTGLALVERVGQLQHDQAGLAVRVGIATGVVMAARRSTAWSARRPISQQGCRPWPNRAASSWTRQRGASSANSSSIATWEPWRSKACRPRQTFGSCSGQDQWRAVSRRYTLEGCLRS
jgi:class 3 adenylate cyclase